MRRRMELAAPRLDVDDAQFRLLVDTVSDYAIFLMDGSGQIASWNAGAERIKGYAAAEILGRPFTLFYTPEDRAAGKPEQMLRRAEREGRAADLGWRVRKDGTRFWADVLITALRDPAGALTGFAKVTRDMTAWRTANARIHDSEALLRAFTDHSPSAMFLKDAGGRYRFVNQRFLQQFGLRREEALGRTDAELFPRAQAERFAAADAEAAAEGRALVAEERVPQFDGERVHMVARFPVLDAAGSLTGVGGVATDITERQRTAQVLAEQRALLAQAQGLAGLGCWEWDPAGGRVQWSDELYRMYGVELGQFQPSLEAYLERVHPEDRDKTAAVVAQALAEGRGFTHEERIVRPDGAVRVLRTHGEVLREHDGRVVKLIGACLDVTEARAHENALQALAWQLVQAEESERRRIAGALHDRVGQVLSALNIQLDIALGEQAQPSLALLEAAVQSVEEVMAELRPPLLDEYGLGAALRSHVEEFARRTGVRATLDDRAREANRGLRREAAVGLYRIAQEALANVAQHAGSPTVALSLETVGKDLVLTVRDEGGGFDPGEVARRGGSWGMTTMRERAHAAGGSLQVSSAPGKGTTLVAKVPL
jgi:PAS domain S-box-containing protein